MTTVERSVRLSAEEIAVGAAELYVRAMNFSYTVLETERLILQEMQWDLLPELTQLLTNPKVHEYFPKTLTEEEAKTFMSGVLRRQREDGFSFWAVFTKSDSVFIGICGLLTQMIDGMEEVEVGYRIDNAVWGCGYGTEAAAGCMRYARDTLKLTSVISLIRDVNRQSIRVAEKNGLTFEKETRFAGLPHRVYRKRF